MPSKFHSLSHFVKKNIFIEHRDFAMLNYIVYTNKMTVLLLKANKYLSDNYSSVHKICIRCCALGFTFYLKC